VAGCPQNVFSTCVDVVLLVLPVLEGRWELVKFVGYRRNYVDGDMPLYPPTSTSSKHRIGSDSESAHSNILKHPFSSQERTVP
jgi:hypothetical protein